ncbi:MAG: DUF1592 domain-containing protein [Planctomycetota bacterium]|nr:DUF1592 domain-containing protein [Planctomycetota bacterium]MDA1214605.1 DUF1592 domain-containing protein [Planctomycetota bacterium]
MKIFVLTITIVAVSGVIDGDVRVRADDSESFDTLTAEYVSDIRPLLKTFCLDCHSTERRQGDFDLERFAVLSDVRTAPRAWQKVAEQLDVGEMPPEDAGQPTAEQHMLLVGWITRYLHAEALANAGDPGSVVLRRLNNAEYTYTIRDLTHVDFHPASEFPSDSAAGEGFTNAGNALSMSPAMLAKYFDAGREIAAHAVLLPDGFRFSKHRTRSDWTDEILSEIKSFYLERVEVSELGLGESVGVMNLHTDCRLGQLGFLPWEQYLAAAIAWRNSPPDGRTTLDVFAQERGLNKKYLSELWTQLNADEPSLLLDDLRTRWRHAEESDAAELARWVAEWQRGLWTFNPIALKGRTGSRPRWQEPVDPLVMSQELRFSIPAVPEGTEPSDVTVSLVIGDAGDGHEHDYVLLHQPRLVAEGQPDVLLRDIDSLTGIDREAFGRHPDGREIDDASLCLQAPVVFTLKLPHDLAVGRDLVTTATLHEETGKEGSVQLDLVSGEASQPQGLQPARVTVTLSQVTVLFADHRTVTWNRPLLIAPDSPLQERLIASLDDLRRLFPPSLCYPQVVPADEVLTMTQFYREDDHLVRLLLSSEEQQQLDRLWSELRYVSQEPIKLLAVLDSLIESMRGQTQDGAFDQLVEPFQEQVAAYRKYAQEHESVQLDALVAFAAQAYRRPLTDEEVGELRELYRQLRSEGLSHDETFRMTLARVLIASPFLFRLETAPKGVDAAPVTDWELASRLSYFLWSSQPDDELRTIAAAGMLQRPDILVQQTQRLLRDNRVRRLATEFGCQWLHIHEFDVVEKKNHALFPEFDELRGAMYEEAILFFTDMFQHDGSLLDLLDADHTFLNENLAAFYGIEGISGSEWRRVDGIQHHRRGGILGFSATLAKQSGASRTSPILRGNWISEVLLGEKLPRPPPDVPQLAEEIPAGLTERQLIERHSSDAACAKCHRRIDPYGFALEGFDAIGRRRDMMSAGIPVDTKTILPEGTVIDGIDGLRRYLLEQRRDDVLRQFCQKLLGYALGREVQLSDEPLLDEIQQSLAENDYRFSVVVEKIVLSRQFREKRSEE